MNLLKTVSLFTLAALMLVASSAHATIVWDWSNAGTGTESGTFTTDGDLIGGLATAGTYKVTDFSLDTTSTSLTLGSVWGGQYAVSQPSVGFIWDGNAPTQFFRGNGAFPNGFRFELDPNPGLDVLNHVSFGVEHFTIDGDDEFELGQVPGFFQESQTINLAPAAVPEPSLIAVWLGLSGIALLRRRRSH